MEACSQEPNTGSCPEQGACTPTVHSVAVWRLSQKFCRGFRCSGVWRNVVGWLVP